MLSPDSMCPLKVKLKIYLTLLISVVMCTEAITCMDNFTFRNEAKQEYKFECQWVTLQASNPPILTRSPSYGERGNVIYSDVSVCVRHEVSKTRCGRTLRHTTFVLGSFERSIPLVWTSLRRYKQFWRVTWPWPIYLAPKWTLQRKSRFFTIFSRCLRPFSDGDIEIILMDSY